MYETRKLKSIQFFYCFSAASLFFLQVRECAHRLHIQQKNPDLNVPLFTYLTQTDTLSSQAVKLQKRVFSNMEPISLPALHHCNQVNCELMNVQYQLITLTFITCCKKRHLSAAEVLLCETDKTKESSSPMLHELGSQLKEVLIFVMGK